LLDQHGDWRTRLQYLLNRWSGQAPYPLHNWDKLYLAQWRLLITGVAVETFVAERGNPPRALRALVPDYLPAVPDDPQGYGPLRYRRDGNRFKVYSAGWNGYYEDGRDEDLGNYSGGDTVFTGPAPKPVPLAVWQSWGQRFMRWLRSP
jgi:hypothetical protein